MVTWSTSTPRSTSSSSTSRYDRPKRRYQRTAMTMTSGGKRKPAKADRGAGTGRGRRVLMPAVSPLGHGHSQRNSPSRRPASLREDYNRCRPHRSLGHATPVPSVRAEPGSTATGRLRRQDVLGGLIHEYEITVAGGALVEDAASR